MSLFLNFVPGQAVWHGCIVSGVIQTPTLPRVSLSQVLSWRNKIQYQYLAAVLLRSISPEIYGCATLTLGDLRLTSRCGRCPDKVGEILALSGQTITEKKHPKFYMVSNLAETPMIDPSSPIDHL